MKCSETSTAERESHSPLTCLGIESTAHTFGAAVAQAENSHRGKILSDTKDIYEPPPGSGIHPREASRHHTDIGPHVVQRALRSARVKLSDLDAIAFSAGPGLGPCLRVGAVVARTLSACYGIPLVPVNHAVGHIELGAFLTSAADPVVLLVTGGHTLISAFAAGRWRIFGETLDLTVGQLLDQFGREAGYASPCGAVIEGLASKSSRYLHLPYTVKGQDVSFSGILTAAKTLLKEGKPLEDLAYSIQETAFAMLAEATERAVAFTEKKELMVVGGVAANMRLQQMLREICVVHGVELKVVPAKYSGDCGAQIAWAGLLAYAAGVTVKVENSSIRQSWRIDQVDAKWRS